MATNVSLGYCLWLAGATWNDSIGRNQHVAIDSYLAVAQGGVLYNTATPLNVTWTSGLGFSVAAGAAVVPSSLGDGAYQVQNPSAQSLTTFTAGGTNPRIDLLCMQVIDNGDNTSYAQLVVVEGTAAPSPAVPATPTDGLALYHIAVPANATALTQSSFTDVRVYTATPGGIVVCPNMSSLPAGYPGLIGYNVAGGYWFALTASGAAPIAILTTSPAEAISTSAVSFTGGTEQTLLTVNFTSDGSNVEIDARCISVGTSVEWDAPALKLYIDSTVVQEGTAITTAYTFGGRYISSMVQMTHVTSAAKGTTPSAGSHTAKFSILGSNSGQIGASTTFPIELSVQQANL